MNNFCFVEVLFCNSIFIIDVLDLWLVDDGIDCK